MSCSTRPGTRSAASCHSNKQLIAECAYAYYGALLASTHGWQDGTNDPWPWLSYLVDQLAQAYLRFEHRTAASRSTGTKQDRLRGFVLNEAANVFRIADVRLILPGVSDQTIRLALETLKKEGLLVADGTGRGATWRKTAANQPD